MCGVVWQLASGAKSAGSACWLVFDTAYKQKRVMEYCSQGNVVGLENDVKLGAEDGEDAGCSVLRAGDIVHGVVEVRKLPCVLHHA